MRQPFYRFAVIFGLSLVILPGSPMDAALRGQTEQVIALTKGFRQERELKAGDTHTYQVSLSAGQVLMGVADQRGVDIVVTIMDPAGKTVAKIDSPNGTNGPEPIKLVAKAAGVYQIVISALDKDAKPGKYEMRVDAFLTADEYADRVAI